MTPDCVFATSKLLSVTMGLSARRSALVYLSNAAFDSRKVGLGTLVMLQGIHEGVHCCVDCTPGVWGFLSEHGGSGVP